MSCKIQYANLKKDKRDYKSAAHLYKKALSIDKNIPIIHFNLVIDKYNKWNSEKNIYFDKVIQWNVC